MARKNKPVVSNYWRQRIDPPTVEKPDVQLVEGCWRLRSMRTAKTLTCSIFRTRAGVVEVRAMYTAGDVAHSKQFGDVQIARDYARTLHELVMSKGEFQPLPPGRGE